MAILRNPKKEKFTVVDNFALRDDRLSLKARGLLVTMMSLPDNWKFSENGLCSILPKDGQASIRSGLKELEAVGYLTRTRTRDSGGRVSDVVWTICDKPRLENPSVVNPNLGNRPQLNTKESNTEKRNTDNTRSASATLEERFSRFWAIYPKKKSKQAALTAWKKLKPDEEFTQKIITDVQKQKQWPEWQKDNGQYIPYPATWLNQRRWEDEGIVRDPEPPKGPDGPRYRKEIDPDTGREVVVWLK